MARKKAYYVFSNRRETSRKKTSQKGQIKEMVIQNPTEMYIKLTFRALIPYEGGKVLIFNPFGDPNKTVVIVPPVRFPLKAKVINKPPEEIISAYIEKK
jgi:hypothetical protein